MFPLVVSLTTGSLARPNANTTDSDVDFILPRSFASANTGLLLSLKRTNLVKYLKEAHLSHGSLLADYLLSRSDGVIQPLGRVVIKPATTDGPVRDTVCYRTTILGNGSEGVGED